VVPTLLAMAATAGAVTILFSLAGSTQRTLEKVVDDANMVVVTEGAQLEPASNLTTEALSDIRVAPGVAQWAGSPAVSAEYMGTLWLDDAETGVPKLVRIRGVDASTLPIHSGAHVVSGRLPERGEPGVVVGRALLGRFVDIREGGAVHFGRHDWPVLGVLEAGSALDSELWCDRAALMEEFHHSSASLAYVRIDDPAHRSEFASHVRRLKGLEAIPERELMERRMKLSGVESQARILEALSLLLVFGAVFATLNALHGSFQSRLRELATLLAIGYRKRLVLRLALQESLLISVCAAAVGLPLGMLIEGRRFTYGSSLFYAVHVDGRALAYGAVSIGGVGLLGAILAAWQVGRLNVLRTLRDA
jgi:putative ABC transport system permease protein